MQAGPSGLRAFKRIGITSELMDSLSNLWNYHSASPGRSPPLVELLVKARTVMIGETVGVDAAVATRSRGEIVETNGRETISEKFGSRVDICLVDDG